MRSKSSNFKKNRASEHLEKGSTVNPIHQPIWQSSTNSLSSVTPGQVFSSRHQFGNIGVAQNQATAVQAKLTMGTENDKYEQQADRVSDSVMRMSEETSLEQPDENNNSGQKQIQRKQKTESITPLIQRQNSLGKNSNQNNIQSNATDSSLVKVSSLHENYINNSSGTGRPLSKQDRQFFEPRFDFNFSRVRIHDDAGAAKTSKNINAQAYTVGQNIFFGENKYQPATATGRHLLAHELTHTVQQSTSSSDQAVSSNLATIQRAPNNSGGTIGLHQSIVDDYRAARNLPPGGVDPLGNQIGPSDAEIIYGGLSFPISNPKSNPKPIPLAALANISPWQLAQIPSGQLIAPKSVKPSTSTGPSYVDYV